MRIKMVNYNIDEDYEVDSLEESQNYLDSTIECTKDKDMNDWFGLEVHKTEITLKDVENKTTLIGNSDFGLYATFV